VDLNVFLPIPTAVINETADTGLSLILQKPRNPASSTVIISRIKRIQAAAQGLNNMTETTTNTAIEMTPIALTRFQFKSRYCSQKVKAIPLGWLGTPAAV
jgi:hypothetical protein